MEVFSGIQYDVADCQSHKAVHDKYVKIGWKTRQAAFAEKQRIKTLRFYDKIFKTEAGQRIVKDAQKKDRKIVTDYIDFSKMSMYNKNIANG